MIFRRGTEDEDRESVILGITEKIKSIRLVIQCSELHLLL